MQHSFCTRTFYIGLGTQALSALLSVIPLCCYPAPTYAAPLDFDSDGISDLALITPNPDETQTLNWKIRLSSSGQELALGSLGNLGDHIAIGDWNESNSSALGVVTRETGSNRLVWQVADQEGNPQNLIFGLDSDIVLSGADFDGSGTLDAAVIKQTRRGILSWRIKLNPFSSEQSETLKINFGHRDNSPFFIRRGDMQSHLAVVTKDGRDVRLHFKNALTLSEESISIRRFLYSYGAPLPLRQENGADLLLFARKGVDRTRFVVLTPTGDALWRGTVQQLGTVVVGDFDDSNAGEEFALVHSQGATVVNPFDGTQSSIAHSIGDDIPVDLININRFGENSSEGGDACETFDPWDGDGGFVWKPNSDTQYFAVAILPGRFYRQLRKVEVFTLDSTLIKELTPKGCANPDSDGPRCAFQDYSLTGRAYKNRYGSIRLRATFKDSTCGTYLIEDPSRRVD